MTDLLDYYATPETLVEAVLGGGLERISVGDHDAGTIMLAGLFDGARVAMAADPPRPGLDVTLLSGERLRLSVTLEP